MEQKKNANSTWCSQAVTHPSTNHAQCCLTAVIRREPVYSTWYGRWHHTMHHFHNVKIRSSVMYPLQVFISHISYFCVFMGFDANIYVLHPIYVHQHIASCSEDTGIASLDVKRPGIEAYHSPPPSSALYVLSNHSHRQLLTLTANNCGHTQ